MWPVIIATSAYKYWHDEYGPGKKTGPKSNSFLDAVERGRLVNMASMERTGTSPMTEYERQKEFAQHGIQWRVEDARRAGLHPITALGAQGASYTPQATVGGGEAPDNSIDNLLSLGQNVARAAYASQSKQEKVAGALQLQLLQSQVEGQNLDNQYRAYQLQQVLGTPGTGAGIPGSGEMAVPGQGDSGFKVVPSESIASKRHSPGIQKGEINTMQYARDADGNLTVVPSKDAKERMEDDFIAEMMWHAKNRVLPPPPSVIEHPLPPGYRERGYKYWMWNPFTQKFIPSKNPSGR